jgi:nickel-dependent lactate racemase
LPKVKLYSNAWYGDIEKQIDFPENWDLHFNELSISSTQGEKMVKDALQNPLGLEPLCKLARSRRNATILVDDLTRPTPSEQILPAILEELQMGGIHQKNIKIIMAIGAHRSLHITDMVKKLGKTVFNKIHVSNHDASRNLEYLGETSHETPIYINNDVVKSDLKIGVGSIIPHPQAGFGGGAKIILPGVAGLKTIKSFHTRFRLQKNRAGLDRNIATLDIEEAARIVGLDFTVNSVVDGQRDIAKIFAGDPLESHKSGTRFARHFYQTEVPRNTDLLVVNAYPCDTELIQSPKSLWATEMVKDDCIVLLIDACSEGLGFHRLTGPQQQKEKEGDSYKKMIFFSGNISYQEASRVFGDGVQVENSWDNVLKHLEQHLPGHADVTVLPNAPLQLK